MRINRQIIILILLLIVVSCKSWLQQKQIYYYGVWPIALYPDNRYQLEYYGGIAKGNWIRRGDTVILNSEYDPYSIEKTAIKYSYEDTSKYSVIDLKSYKSVNASPLSFIHLYNINTFRDTVLFFFEQTSQKILKKKEYNVLQVELIHIGASAYSQRLDFISKDTITVYVDYPNFSQYMFFKNTKAIINDKNHELIKIQK